MEYQNGQPLPGRAPAGAHAPHLERISRPEGTVPLAREMPVKTIADLLEVGDDRIWRVLDHYVPAARALEDFSDVTAVGIDETAARRGHNYITLFHDLDERRLLFACEGRDADTIKTFAEDLRAHGGDPDAVTAACIDMSRAYIAGVGRHLPKAAITFDRFHVIQLANAALEEVRRSECQRRSKIRPLGGAKPGHFGFGRNARHVAAASQPRLPNSWRLTGRLGPSGPSQRGSCQAVSVDFRARLCARR